MSNFNISKPLERLADSLLKIEETFTYRMGGYG